MTPDILRDSAVGMIINLASGGRLLPFADQRGDYVIPSRYTSSATVAQPSTSPAEPSRMQTNGLANQQDGSTLVDEAGVVHTKYVEGEKLDVSALETNASPETLSPEQVSIYPFLVDWDGSNDPANPRNWSTSKRMFVAFQICFMTTAVYIGSAIYTSSIESIMQEFGVIQVVATLGLSLFILGYSIGPIFLGPLQDAVAIGRTPIYIGGLFLYVLFQMPVLLAPNIGTILVFRFFAGFVGSPALSTGGTSMTELFPMHVWAYAIGFWAIGAVCGPVLGPVIGGFAAQANGWRWPIYELLWISGFALIILALFLPETSEKTILYRRAVRLRRLTGNTAIKTQHELDAGHDNSIFKSVRNNFVVGLKISADPAIGFANVYIGLVYAIFYLWFETFPIVFTQIHGFNLGVAGLPYLGFVVTAVITFTFYVLYNKLHMDPGMMRGDMAPENRLELGIMAGMFIPISLFMCGWGAKAHWIVPVIGAALYFPGIFLLFQSILMFVSMYVKPEYNSSVMASNTFFRSSFAAAFPLFGAYYVKALGVGGSCSLLAGVSIVMVPVLWLLHKNGKQLRQKLKYPFRSTVIDNH